ncbi:MAG: hypothetical protein U0946_04565 [Patescibacteria group bacterium]|nr:hypothetical protein [Patescibacteria group bacterium]
MKLTVILVFLFTILFLTPSSVFAKKKLTRGKPYGVWIKPKLRSDNNALILAFGSLDYATDLNYALTYSSDGVAQGVQGEHQPETNNFQTELLFGTCSGTNCTYHQNITDMILEVKVNLKIGKTLTQRYQINP